MFSVLRAFFEWIAGGNVIRLVQQFRDEIRATLYQYFYLL